MERRIAKKTVEMKSETQPFNKRMLIVTSVSAEKEAVLRGIGEQSHHVDIVVSGVGSAAAAAATSTALARTTYDIVVNMGIAGGFAGKVEIGALVLGTEAIAADLGAESEKGFISLDELGFGTSKHAVHPRYQSIFREALQTAGLEVNEGPILTVSTVTGRAESAEELARRVPDASAEAMEGFGVATAANAQGIPFLELRAISNRVGPRDRESWRIGEALSQLEKANRILAEVFR